MALEATGLLTYEMDPGGTTLVYSHNGFNKLSQLMMLCTVCHRWPVGEWFAFNCYSRWAQLLLCQTDDKPVIILSQERFTQGDLI